MAKNEEQMFPDHEILKKMIARGVPCRRSEFHSAVDNADKTPENFFDMDSAAKSRQVKMYWISGDGVLCLQNNSSGKLKSWMVPLSTVKATYFE